MQNRTKQLGVLITAAAGLLLGASGICAAASAGHTASSNPVQVNRTLTLDTVNKLLKAEQNLVKVGSRDMNLEMALAMNGTPDTFQSWLARIKSNPKAVEAIQAAGLTPEEYLEAYVAVIQASAVAGATHEGRQIPAELKSQVPAANVSFVEAHRQEIGQIAKPGSPVKPNTMEDIYASSDAPKDDPKAAPATDAAKKP